MAFINKVEEASQSAIKYRWFFKKRANLLYLSGKSVLNSMYQGFIGRATRSDKGITTIKTKVIDTPIRLIGLLSNFNENQWLTYQRYGNIIKTNSFRDNLDSRMKSKAPSFSFKKDDPSCSAYIVYLNSDPPSGGPGINYIYPCVEGKVISFSSILN